MEFRRAAATELEGILELYRSVIGTEFCTWNEFYPGEEEIGTDYRNNNLFVMVESEQLLGALSVIYENELDELDYWKVRSGAVREIARVVVNTRFQGKGIAYEMVRQIEGALKGERCTAIHLLVACKNIPAYKTYMKAGFKVMGECDMYGNHYYACEKLL